MRSPRTGLAAAATALLVAAAGCDRGGDRGNPANRTRDLAVAFAEADLAGSSGDAREETACGDFDPACLQPGFGPDTGNPFPVEGGSPPDPGVRSDGVGVDAMGWIALDQSRASFDYLWIANSMDFTNGTVSKIDSKTVREVARYTTVTCFSNASGGAMECDGTKGCCAADDYPRWKARKGGAPMPPRQKIDHASLSPSRTAIDFNGDMFVANRAFNGQSSLTKIANDAMDCIDRNHDGRIDTSNDANANGVIEVDCNGDGVPDDGSVKTCTGGGKPEFFGGDDECILFTTNTGDYIKWGRPLGLGPGAVDGGPSDAWAGTFNDGRFYRIDGTSGQYKDEVQLPSECHPYGLAVDQDGYGWAPNLGEGPLCFFNTRKTSQIGQARDAVGFRMNGYGCGLDREQSIWVGGLGSSDAYRYVPDRTQGFSRLGQGYWTKFTDVGKSSGNSGGTYAVAADSRSPSAFFVFTSTDGGYVARIPASTIAKPKMDQIVDGAAWPAVKVAGANTRGVGVDRDQNVWGVSYAGSVATRIDVDAQGRMKTPDILSSPVGKNACPAGDRCPLKGLNSSDPRPYTYSDFTGFGLRNFTRPKGSYSYVFKGCVDGQGNPLATQWYALVWDAEVPPSTGLAVRARVGATPVPDATWGQWTTTWTASPADLRGGTPLVPFDMDNAWLQLEFSFTTMDRSATPRLKWFKASYKCRTIG